MPSPTQENASLERDRWWKRLPNLITGARIAGSPLLIWLGYAQQPWGFLLLIAFLVLTEWLDGFLARRLHAESPMGARLDSVADAVFYGCLLLGIACLVPRKIQAEAVWIGAAILSYWLSWLVSWLKFRSLPSYHTWLAKGAWFVVAPGIVLWVFAESVWLFQLAMVVVVVANLEATLISLTLPRATVDVPTYRHALRRVEKTKGQSSHGGEE